MLFDVPCSIYERVAAFPHAMLMSGVDEQAYGISVVVACIQEFGLCVPALENRPMQSKIDPCADAKDSTSAALIEDLILQDKVARTRFKRRVVLRTR